MYYFSTYISDTSFILKNIFNNFLVFSVYVGSDWKVCIPGTLFALVHSAREV